MFINLSLCHKKLQSCNVSLFYHKHYITPDKIVLTIKSLEDCRKFFKSSAPYRILPMAKMSEYVDAEKADFNCVMRDLVNATLDAEEKNTKFALRVEEVDIGIFIHHDERLADFLEEEGVGDLVYPVYKEDLTVDASLLAELIVREITGGSLSKVMVRIYINEDREVEIKNRVIYETEIVGRELKTAKQRKAVEKMLEEKANVLTAVVKGAIERITRGGKM
jgi:hypothetical protein